MFPQKRQFHVVPDNAPGFDCEITLTARNRNDGEHVRKILNKKHPGWKEATMTRLNFVRSDGIIPSGKIFA